MKKVLVLNDFVSWGRLAGSQVDTILTYKDIDVLFLPTTLISNMFSLGKISMLDTTEYMRETFEKWSKADINFDAIFIGYIKNRKQMDLIKNFISSLSYHPLIVQDPIMADNGSLYKGLDPDIVNIHRELSEISDIIIPNFTEAKILASNDDSSIKDIVEILSNNNKKKIIITSYKNNKGSRIISYENKKFEEFPYEYIDKSFAGTGDIFDGIFLANYLQLHDFNLSIKKTKDSMSKILKRKMLDDKESVDIKIEKYLDLI